jgi:hypothetical protein
MFIDKRMTRERRKIQDFHKNMGIKPTKGKFRCSNFKNCCRSLGIRRRDKIITGSWPYIGVAYGKSTIAGKLLRIVVIGMDAGGAKNPVVNFQRRQEEWRCAFEYGIKNPRTPHPTGTALLLRELVDDKRENRFARQFTFVNAVKCSPKNGKMTSSISSQMCSRCETVLSKELGILKPDVIFTQGSYPRYMIQNIFKQNQKIFETKKVMIYRSGKPIICATPHPTRHIKWKQGILPRYYINAIQKVRQIV